LNRLDQLLGPGAVTAQAGALRLDDTMIAAELHRQGDGVRCWCLACRGEREKDRVAGLSGYLAVLAAEREVDVEEVMRVRRELPKSVRRARQPWEPVPLRSS
jgi:hypothetical protein